MKAIPFTIRDREVGIWRVVFGVAQAGAARLGGVVVVAGRTNIALTRNA